MEERSKEKKEKRNVEGVDESHDSQEKGIKRNMTRRLSLNWWSLIKKRPGWTIYSK